MSQHVITINFVIETDDDKAGPQEQEEYLRGIGQNIIESLPKEWFEEGTEQILIGDRWLTEPYIVDTKVLGVA